MKDTEKGPRLIKQAVRHIHEYKQPGDLLMDVGDDTWDSLLLQSQDRDEWRERVRQLQKIVRGKRWIDSKARSTYDAETQRAKTSDVENPETTNEQIPLQPKMQTNSEHGPRKKDTDGKIAHRVRDRS